MKQYKSAIEIRRADSKIRIVPHVRTVIEDTENIEFIYERQEGELVQGGTTQDMADIIKMLENLIFDSVMEN